MKIPDPEKTCKLLLGSECCAYLVLEPGGFACAKGDSSLASIISKRLLAGTMVAKGTGDWEECYERGVSRR